MDARQACAAARPGRAVLGWKLAASDRERLLERFPPRYAAIVADHVTLKPRVDRRSRLPQEREARVVGWTDDGQGVQALVVSIGGTTERPDGSTYHLTWSLGEGRRAKESNDVLRERGWTAIEVPVAVSLEPAVF